MILLLSEDLKKRAETIADETARQFALEVVAELDEIQTKLNIGRDDRIQLRKRIEIGFAAIGCGVIAGGLRLAGALSEDFLSQETPFTPLEFKNIMHSGSSLFLALAIGIFMGKPGHILARILNIPISVSNVSKPK